MNRRTPSRSIRKSFGNSSISDPLTQSFRVGSSFGRTTSGPPGPKSREDLPGLFGRLVERDPDDREILFPVGFAEPPRHHQAVQRERVGAPDRDQDDLALEIPGADPLAIGRREIEGVGLAESRLGQDVDPGRLRLALGRVGELLHRAGQDPLDPVVGHLGKSKGGDRIQGKLPDMTRSPSGPPDEPPAAR